MEAWIIEILHINRIRHQATENMDVLTLKHDKVRYTYNKYNQTSSTHKNLQQHSANCCLVK